MIEKKVDYPSFATLWRDIKKYKKLHTIVLGVTFVVTVFYTLCLPNYYTCTVKLAPELAGGNKGASGLASLVSSFGVNLGSNNSGVDAIMPTLYPDLMNSVTFKASLFSVKVQREDDGTAMTYYDYLKKYQEKPWWSKAGGALLSIFTSDKVETEKVNTFKLTREQNSIIETIDKKVVCDVDNMTMVITINVTDQDPLIAATMADSVQMHLQNFITDYRTRKARIDLAYNQKLYKEAKERYEKARKRSAAFNDANQRVFLERIRSEAADLENETQLQLRAYSQVAAQLQVAEAKVQEETPAFTTLQPASVPIKKKGPQRARICLMALFIAFIGTSIYAIHKEGHLSSL